MRFPALGLVLLLLHAGPARAATNAPAGLQPERWLMVVDVSSPMKTRAPAVTSAVAGLLNSSMNGQLLEGHEIGLWTFNDQLHTDLDVMKWMDFRTNAIKQRLMTHLAEQKYGRQPSFDETLENLKAVVKGSRRITLILISDGDELFTGTPHEAAIAEFFRANREAARSGKVPIITVLRGLRGEWAGVAQSYPPWPVTFPEFPPEPEPRVKSQAQMAKAQETSPSPTKRPVMVAEPLVVRGPDPLSKEIEEKGLATNTANLVLQKPAPPSPPAGSAVSNDQGVAENPAEPDPTWSRPVMETPNPQPRRPPVWLMIGAAGGLLAVAVAAALVLRRRVSSRHRTSLITRAMNGDRDKP